MARHYSPKHFFRQMPNALLGRYFARHGLFPDLDFSSMKEGRPEPLIQAWEALPDDQRRGLDAEMHDIFALCDAKGLQALIDEASGQLRETPDALASLIEDFASLGGHYERAMVAFLDHPELWKGASRFRHADSLGYWRKRGNMPKTGAAKDTASCMRLAELIGAH